MTGRRVLAGSLGASFALLPLYPAFITLTGAPVPGIAILPRPLALALLGLVSAIAVYWIVLLLNAPKRPLPTLLPVAALPAAALVAALLGFDPFAGVLFIAILAGGVLWHATILRFAREPGMLAAIARAYVISGALAALIAIVTVLSKTPAASYTIGHGRAVGTFVLPGELAGYLIVYVPVAIALARARLGVRAFAVAGLVLAAIAFVLTFSRAGWVGMAAALAALVLLQNRGRGARYAAAIMGTALVVVLLAFNTHHDPSENFTRLSIWSAALRTIALFPLAGVGPFEFAHLYPAVRIPGGEPLAYHAHSVILTIAAETGLIGVAALLFGWWRFIAELRVRLHARSPYGTVAVAIAAGLIGTWVQGAIDTISVVIFALWLPFMALALICAEPDPRDVPAQVASPASAGSPMTGSRDAGSLTAGAPTAGSQLAGPSSAESAIARTAAPARYAVALVAALAVMSLCGAIQVASSAVYAAVAAPHSLPAHLSSRLGTRIYASIERVAPLPLVETTLAEDALRRGDLGAASTDVARIPLGAVRSDLQARIAAARGDTHEAIRHYLDAADDEALQPLVTAQLSAGRLREAYDLERRIGDRLATAATRPNALADSSWRLARLAIRLGNTAEAARDYNRAIELAPLNTKYLLDAALLALDRKDLVKAATLFTRASTIDPADADAIAGVGLVALRAGDIKRGKDLLALAEAINANATLVRRLRRALH